MKKDYFVIVILLLVGICVIPQLLLSLSLFPYPEGSENLAQQINNATAPIINISTLVGVFATFLFQRRAHRNQIDQINNNHEAEMALIRRENAFNYIDTLFNKFSDYLPKNFFSIRKKKLESIIKQAYNNGGTKESVRHDIEQQLKALQDETPNFIYLRDYVKSNVHLDKEVKKLYLKKLKNKFSEFHFKDLLLYSQKTYGINYDEYPFVESYINYHNEIEEERSRCVLDE